jgi:hypothetical protein
MREIALKDEVIRGVLRARCPIETLELKEVENDLRVGKMGREGLRNLLHYNFINMTK